MMRKAKILIPKATGNKTKIDHITYCMTDNTKWVKIFSTGDLFDAELLRTKLVDSGIECQSLNKKDSAYLFGEIELYVEAEDVIKAKHIIQNKDQQGE